MEKVKQLLQSKAFWTLVAAIVAALTAFFTASCSSAVHVIRHGVHVDTVRLDYEAKTKNFQTVCQNSNNPTTPIIGLMIEKPTSLSFAISSPAVSRSISTKWSSCSSSPDLCRLTSSRSLISSEITNSRFVCSSHRLCSDEVGSMLKSHSVPSFSWLLALSPLGVIVRCGRRGGRRGGSRPKGPKTVNLGGRHL